MTRRALPYLARQHRWWFCPRCCALYLVEPAFERTPKFGSCFEHTAPVTLRLITDVDTLRWLRQGELLNQGQSS